MCWAGLYFTHVCPGLLNYIFAIYNDIVPATASGIADVRVSTAIQGVGARTSAEGIVVGTAGGEDPRNRALIEAALRLQGVGGGEVVTTNIPSDLFADLGLLLAPHPEDGTV